MYSSTNVLNILEHLSLILFVCAINRKTVSILISASNDYENTLNGDKTIVPHSAPFPAVRCRSSIKAQFHVQISKIM